jgi:pyrimidine deaminase RibD-like protein
MTDQELKDLVASLAIDTKELKVLFAKNEKRFEKLHAEMGAIGHSNGDAAEAFFYNSLEEDMKLGKVKFDFISKNVKQKKHRQEEEYDIFLENGNAVGIIEVKYKVQQKHIEKLVSKKAENFRILFPDYTDYKLYVGIAGLSFEPNTEQMATENGLVVLKQKGDVMQVNSENMTAF